MQASKQTNKMNKRVNSQFYIYYNLFFRSTQTPKNAKERQRRIPKKSVQKLLKIKEPAFT